MATRYIVTASIGAPSHLAAVTMLREAADLLQKNPGEKRIPLTINEEEEGCVYVTTYEEDD